MKIIGISIKQDKHHVYGETKNGSIIEIILDVYKHCGEMELSVFYNIKEFNNRGNKIILFPKGNIKPETFIIDDINIENVKDDIDNKIFHYSRCGGYAYVNIELFE